MANFIVKSLDSLVGGGRLLKTSAPAVTDYAIFMLDNDGNVLSWNAGAERFTGYTEDEMVGHHFSAFFASSDWDHGKPQDWLRIAAQTGRFEDEGWRVRKGGTSFPTLATIDAIHDHLRQLVGFAMVTRDTSERHAAEKVSRKNEQLIRLLVNNVIDYAVIMLDLDGTITNWSSGAKLIKGYNEDEIVGQNFAVLYTDEDQLAGMPAAALATAAAVGRYEATGWRVRRDGSRFWANVVIDAIPDETGRLIGFGKVTRDLTQARAHDQAKEQLYQAQKLETVGQLTSGVAHDFNNLLTVVTGSLSLISNATDDARVLRLVGAAERAVARGAKLTAQLLAFSRKQMLRPRTLKINDLIGGFEMLLRGAAGGAVVLKLDLDLLLRSANLDPAQFESALLNLVVNARDAMPVGGTLTIETRNALVDPTLAARYEIKPGPYVIVTVRDTGEGMTPETKTRAIEPFYTTKEVGKGTGLGLSQVYGFARQSNGHIEIESEIGQGTSVRMFLPLTTELTENAPIAAATEQEIAKSQTILVVEDDPDLLEVAIQIVQSLGYAVYSARNAQEALSVLQRDVPIDLMFTDIIMPGGIDGVDLAHRARVMRPDLRVLLSSGYARDSLASDEDKANDVEFLAKPYLMGELGDRLEALMRTDRSGATLH